MGKKFPFLYAILLDIANKKFNPRRFYVEKTIGFIKTHGVCGEA